MLWYRVNRMFELYDYQEEGIAAIRREFKKGKRKIIYQLPTGGGKTIMMGFMAKSAAEKGRRTWFVVHRKQLLDQAHDKLMGMDIPCGQIKPKSKLVDAPVKVVMVQSALARINSIKELGLEPHNIIFDEAHHCGAATYGKIIRAFPDAMIIGLTATPERPDGKGLVLSGFESIVSGPSTKELIERGFLAPYRIFVPPNNINLDRVRTSEGDYNLKDLAKEMDIEGVIPKLSGDALEHYIKHLSGKRALGFTINVNHAIKMAEFFRQNGIPADYIDGEMSDRERRVRLEAFSNGDLLVLFSCDLIGEGFDVPACEGVLLLRPTKSLVLYLQQCGRGLRSDPDNPDKVAIIIDHANNSDAHGLPDDDRDWSLEGKKKRKKSAGDDVNVLRLKVCPGCHLKMAISVAKCEYCGHVFTTTPGTPPKASDVNLIEIDPEAIRLQKEQFVDDYNICVSLSDFRKLAKKQKYSPGWAWIQWRACDVLARAPGYKNSFLCPRQIAEITQLRLDSIEKVLVELERKHRLSNVPSAIINNVKCYQGDLILIIWSKRTRSIGAKSVKTTHGSTKQNDISTAKTEAVNAAMD